MRLNDLIKYNNNYNKEENYLTKDEVKEKHEKAGRLLKVTNLILYGTIIIYFAYLLVLNFLGKLGNVSYLLPPSIALFVVFIIFVIVQSKNNYKNYEKEFYAAYIDPFFSKHTELKFHRHAKFDFLQTALPDILQFKNKHKQVSGSMIGSSSCRTNNYISGSNHNIPYTVFNLTLTETVKGNKIQPIFYSFNGTVVIMELEQNYPSLRIIREKYQKKINKKEEVKISTGNEVIDEKYYIYISADSIYNHQMTDILDDALSHNFYLNIGIKDNMLYAAFEEKGCKPENYIGLFEEPYDLENYKVTDDYNKMNELLSYCIRIIETLKDED